MEVEGGYVNHHVKGLHCEIFTPVVKRWVKWRMDAEYPSAAEGIIGTGFAVNGKNDISSRMTATIDGERYLAVPTS